MVPIWTYDESIQVGVILSDCIRLPMSFGFHLLGKNEQLYELCAICEKLDNSLGVKDSGDQARTKLRPKSGEESEKGEFPESLGCPQIFEILNSKRYNTVIG